MLTELPELLDWIPGRVPSGRRRSRCKVGPAEARGQALVEFALVAPVMFFLVVAILDFARVFTTMMSVESAAREAADFGTTLGAERWSDSNRATTLAEMRRRACVAASDLPDYVGIDVDADGIDEDCSNPTMAEPVLDGQGLDIATNPCDDGTRDPPCTVSVRLAYAFELFVPFHIDFFGVELGLPHTLTFERDSTFAMTDIDVAPSASP